MGKVEKTNYGVGSLVCGILSWFILAIVFLPMSIYYGVKGLNSKGESNTLSIIGLIISIVEVLFLLIAFMALV